MKKRNNTIRWIVFAAILVWAIYSLVPTYRVYFSSEKDRVEKIELKKELRSISKKIEAKEELTKVENTLYETYKDSAEYFDISKQDLEDYNKYQSVKEHALALGLDLQGGMHLVLEINYRELMDNMAKNKDAQLSELLAEVSKRIEQDPEKSKEDFFNTLEQVFKEKNVLLNKYYGQRGATASDVIAHIDSTAKKGIETTLQVLRNRIDQFGISEPSIQKQGNYRIVVELPGVKDEERAQGIVDRAAYLEFKLVAEDKTVNSIFDKLDNVYSTMLGSDKDSTEVDSTDMAANFEKTNPFRALLIGGRAGEFLVSEANKAKVDKLLITPAFKKAFGEYQLVWHNKDIQNGNVTYHQFFIVKAEAEMDGTTITDANPVMSSGDNATGAWEVAFAFNRQGARKFASVTGMNIKRRLAIILDGKLTVAPTINDRIPSGTGTISSFTAEEARDLAIVLKAGALPAPLEIMEKRVIGPSLGSDSIRSGVWAAIGGLVIVMIFMIYFYKLSGVFAVLALNLNIILLLSILGYFSATLTLPGIAGVILTIGMAVDANVLIFERIKEELRDMELRNKKYVTPYNAVNAGYEKAFSTIFDANITTFIAGIVLYQFGTGPIKGFALTLMIGILCSMYTAIIVTRLFADLVYNKDSKKISV